MLCRSCKCQVVNNRPTPRWSHSAVCVTLSPGVFITKGDVGVGTIVGSAVFNILCIIGVCGFFAGQV